MEDETRVWPECRRKRKEEKDKGQCYAKGLKSDYK